MEDYISSIIEKTKESGELVQVHQNNGVYYIVMNSGQNTFNRKFVDALENAFKSIEKSNE